MFFFQFINKSMHIYVPLYFLSLFVILVIYESFRYVFFLKSFPENLFRGKEGQSELAGSSLSATYA